MVSERKALYTLLTANSTLTSTLTGGIHFEFLPEKFTRPCMLVTGMSGTPEELLSDPTSLITDRRIQFDILAAAGNSGMTTIETVRDLLVGSFDVGYTAITVSAETFQLLRLSPINYGMYLEDQQGLRFTIDFYADFGIR